MEAYATHPLALEKDPVITPGAHGRADIASGKMSKWLRFNRAEDLIWLTAPDGRMCGLTRNQVNVYLKIRSVSGKADRQTMRAIAEELHISPSTVYRAAVKLTSLGFIAYQSNRGRNGGSMFILREAGDRLEWAQEDARAKVRRWRKAAEARISRLRANVASCFPGRERELYQYRYLSTDTERNKYSFGDDVAEWLGDFGDRS